MYKEVELSEYVAEAAAGHSTPGGGSVSALAGALAAAMSEMCASFTVKSDKYASVHRTAKEMLRELTTIRERLMDLVEEDVEAYKAVTNALRMPKSTEMEKAARKQTLDGAFRAALEPPRQVMRNASRVSHIAGKLVDIGNRNLITDVGASAILAEATCAAARLNIEVNLTYLGDRVLAKKLKRELDSYCSAAESMRTRVMRKIQKFLKKRK
jgi:formiminotetrahydrofolate cyclodeaminase